MKNQVLQDGHRTSRNFWESDLLLRYLVGESIPAAHRDFLDTKLQPLGALAANEMNGWSLRADHQPPELVKRDFYGRDVDEIRFHPDYDRLKAAAVHSGMFSMKWEPQLRARFAGHRHQMGFAAGLLYAMSELGLYCPLCMTDGVALLLDRHASEADKARLLPRIYTQNPDELYTGAMFLTEKAGGSDVGANLVYAEPLAQSRYKLFGEKWFCSNANAEIIFALARTRPTGTGTRGLGIFLLEPTLPNGQRNAMRYVRLKDKLGVRSMASAECLLEGAEATLVGGEQDGFKIMTEMINLSRIYNSVAASGGLRRAVVEAYQFLSFRQTFGKPVLQHALVRRKLTELAALSIANYLLVWRAIQALDRAEHGNPREEALLRLLTPLTKKSTAADAAYGVREAMELMGGMGYIEDGVMPKILRDVLVLPIWEGAGNIMTLDALRASAKSEGLGWLLEEIRAACTEPNPLLDAESAAWVLGESQRLAQTLQQAQQHGQDALEASAAPIFERLIRLYQLALLAQQLQPETRAWALPAWDYWYKQLRFPAPQVEPPLEADAVAAMLLWEF